MSVTNQAVQSMNIARDLTFWILKEEVLYYPSSEISFAGYKADLRLCFGICKKPVFTLCGSFNVHVCTAHFVHMHTDLVSGQSMYLLSYFDLFVLYWKLRKATKMQKLHGIHTNVDEHMYFSFKDEPRRQKTGLRGFQPGPTQTGLGSHRRWLET